LKITVKIGLLAVANIILAFFYHWYIVVQIGPGTSTDALFVGMVVPQLILSIISTSLVRVLVPFMSGEEKSLMLQDAWTFLFLIAFLFGSMALILFLFSHAWVPLIVPGFDEAGKQLTIRLTEVQLISMVFISINAVQLATCYVKQRFLWAEFSNTFSSAIAFLTMIAVLPEYGVYGAAFSTVARYFIQTVFLLPVLEKPVMPNLKSARVKTVWSKIKPLLAGNLYYKTEPLIDRIMLSTATSGTLSLYYLGQQIYSSGCQVLNKSIATPLNTALSKSFKLSEYEKFSASYQYALKLNLLLSFAAFALVLMTGQYFLEILVSFQKLSHSDADTLFWILVWLGGTLVGGATGQVSSTALYSCGDTKTPTRIGMITYSFYIPIKIFVFFKFGIQGLALSTSVFVLVNFFFQHAAMSKKIKTDFKEHRK